MDKRKLEKLLEQVRAGKLSVGTAMRRLKHFPYEDLGLAKIDHHRGLRHGFPEVVLAEGKTHAQLTAILARMDRAGHDILVTRVSEAQARAVKKKLAGFKYDRVSRTLTKAKGRRRILGRGVILVVSAGTSDIPVAEEAAVTARLMGNEVETLYDVGVAGIHRLLDKTDALERAGVIIVCAGMEGALASVVGGLVDRPVIGVPTSVGYGASFGGVGALLGMLNSCAANVTVVNIDNGFGAAYVASLINRLPAEGKDR